MEDKDNLNPGNKQVTKEIVADLTEVPGPSDTTQEPWIIGDDFNDILHQNDRIYGASVTTAEIKDFTKIDRENSDWMMQWGHAIATYDLLNISDHSPMKLKVERVIWRAKTSFKFFNIWINYSTFDSMVTSIWNQQSPKGKMPKMWTKLKALKHAIKSLDKEEFLSNPE
ncbi:hypothetical protein H5410_001275 [Solanum commersonii]|uniref:Uncharacterized protein n=1 Tax=Solanum commersonii TaxID=4109 RepID=A0A9J6AYG6_SOLCO|nr:hypothetical protein H5410_001275 [Solanum commersonii]